MHCCKFNYPTVYKVLKINIYSSKMQHTCSNINPKTSYTIVKHWRGPFKCILLITLAYYYLSKGSEYFFHPWLRPLQHPPDSQSSISQGFGCATWGDQRQPHIHQPLGEVQQSSFVWHTQKSCEDELKKQRDLKKHFRSFFFTDSEEK